MAPLCPFPLASSTKQQALLWIPLALGIKTKVLPRPWRPFLIHSPKTSPASSHTISHIRPSSYPPFHQPWPCFTLFFAWNTLPFPLAFRCLIHTAFMALLKPHFFQDPEKPSQTRRVGQTRLHRPLNHCASFSLSFSQQQNHSCWSYLLWSLESCLLPSGK